VPLLHLLLTNPAGWVLARALTGFCFAGLFIVVESWFNGAATMETRGQVLSIYGMTGLMAGIGGQLLLPATDYTGFAPFCIVAIILAYALVPIVVNRSTAPAMTNDGAARINLITLNRQAPFGVVPPSCPVRPAPNATRNCGIFSVTRAHPVGTYLSVLPDVKFSHEQHLQAGMQCATCHGPVADRPAMSELTAVTSMATCISCHQSKNVSTERSTFHAWPTPAHLASWHYPENLPFPGGPSPNHSRN
jgi:Cytochrome c7 and related cytochrome c